MSQGLRRNALTSKAVMMCLRARQEAVTHPVQLDIGMLRGRQAQRVDLDVAEGPGVASGRLGAHLAHHLVQRHGLACARHARHVQTLPQALIACASRERLG